MGFGFAGHRHEEQVMYRVSVGKCIVYSAQSCTFCEAEGKHVVHRFTSVNGNTHHSSLNID